MGDCTDIAAEIMTESDVVVVFQRSHIIFRAKGLYVKSTAYTVRSETTSGCTQHYIQEATLSLG